MVAGKGRVRLAEELLGKTESALGESSRNWLKMRRFTVQRFVRVYGLRPGF
jgi:hypothetical protein